MTRSEIIAIILAVCVVSWCHGASHRIRPWNSKLLERRTRSTDPSVAAIRDVLHRISSGESNPKDDEELVKLIKEEIIQTAYKVKTPSVSIEAAAKRAQNLVSELTSAYTTAIYSSKNTEEARRNFLRFQGTVQQIVDFTKTGQFVS